MRIVEIFSPRNQTFKTFLKLTGVRGIRQYRMAILSGPRQTEEVLEEFPERCEAIIFSPDHSPPVRTGTGHIRRYCLDQGLFRQLDISGTDQPLLVVRFGTFPRFSPAQPVPGCTLCIPFQDPANVGSVIRTAAGLGVSRVVLLKEAAHPFHPRSTRAAGSSIFRIPLFSGPSLKQLSVSGAPLITLSPDGEKIAGYRFPSDFYLVPGLEGPGVPASLESGTCLAIPMKNGVKSLNAAMATGIALYLWQMGVDRGALSRS
ncbi:MAG: RNA methyltransferase [Deltaproteobacteria bacterium]|nr:RNA methyltransferase [Deltaproteobacteria bacterium]MBW2048541.1 RNA methyltransferase [Deltaproteobacteria bacterium]MBW2110918.1 RNA methyltransferase [Deltaproteobacteria bacterium]MBW2353302.1 RNA methyltransferase [Deltaproteobacteria bacterium]